MAKFKGAVLNCVTCGAEFRVSPSRAASAKTCSDRCAIPVRAKSRERRVTLTCKGCGGEFRVPRCHESRRAFCSTACTEASPSIQRRKAERVGGKNGNWKGGRNVRADGYIYASTGGPHPLAAPNGLILEHRLVMERWLIENEPDSPFLILIRGRPCLSPEYEVHHKDLTHSNNDIDNLQCLTRAEHRALHAEITRAALEYYRINVINAAKE